MESPDLYCTQTPIWAHREPQGCYDTAHQTRCVSVSNLTGSRKLLNPGRYIAELIFWAFVKMSKRFSLCSSSYGQNWLQMPILCWIPRSSSMGSGLCCPQWNSGWRLDATLLPGVSLSCSVRHGLSLLPSSAGFFRPRTLQQLFWLMQSQEDTRWKDAEALATTWIREVKRKEVSASNTKDEVWKGRVKVIALIEPIGFL